MTAVVPASSSLIFSSETNHISSQKAPIFKKIVYIIKGRYNL